MRIVTTCSVDCPDNCGVIANIKHGQLLNLEGNPDHAVTKGFLCNKGYHFKDRLYSEDRILYPQKKTNSGWKRINWDEALDIIAENIEFYKNTYGNESIMHFHRTASWGCSKQLVRRFFNLLGGVTTTSGSLCSGSVMAAQKSDMGVRLGNDPEEIANSKTIIIWGKDPKKSSIHLIPFILNARKQGAMIIVIDPIETSSVSFADKHVAPRPGTDGYLAMGIAKQILKHDRADYTFIGDHTNNYEKYLSLINSFTMDDLSNICNVDIETIKELALCYTEYKPSSILLGYGINKWIHSPEMIRLIDALGALSGNIGISGGGVNHGFQTKRHFDPQVLAPEFVKYKREIPEPLLAQGILESKDPHIKMIWIDGSNPAASCPNSNKVIKAINKLEFVVVVDSFLTDTAELADIFLPTTTFLEEEDIVVSWGHNWIGPVNKAIEPLGESKSDLHIVQELAQRIGLGTEMAGTTRQWLKRILKPMEDVGLSVDQVMEAPVRCPVAPMVAFKEKKFLTKSGKFEFIFHVNFQKINIDGYHLLSVLPTKWINTTVLKEDHPKIQKAFIHPSVAEKKQLIDKSRALLQSSVGQLEVEIHLTKSIHHNAIAVSHGTWMKFGGGVNQLTEDLISTSGGMAAYYSTMVDIEPISDESEAAVTNP